MFTKVKKYLFSHLHKFSKKQWAIFYVAFSVLCIATITLIYTQTKKTLVEIPRFGGTYSEGMIGVPRFINPVLAFTDTDKDLTQIVFAGLFKYDEKGTIVPLLAEKYTTSEDELTYTVILKKDLVFHNNKKITAEDVVFTINKIQNPTIKSPKENIWKGVEVSAVDESTIQFKLKQRFGDFMDMLTVGIISKDEWSNVTDEEFGLTEKNLHPVGSGPYQFKSKDTTKENIPTSITLSYFKKYTLGKPFIKKLIFKFYSNEKQAINAININEVDTIGGISPENVSLVSKENTIFQGNLPRIFGLFLNSSEQPIFRDSKIVKAINQSINKKGLIEEVLLGYGQELTSPVPFPTKNTEEDSYSTEEAKILLEKDGYLKDADGLWKKNGQPISFTIVTTDVDELKSSATYIQKNLREFGIDVKVETYDMGSLTQNILNQRKYDALVFGQIINTPSNLFAFWHSSERNAPGLNITMYANSTVDTALEKLRKEIDEEEKRNLLTTIEKELKEDRPMIPLFKPTYIEVQRNIVFNKQNQLLSTYRFSNIEKWSLKRDHVWNIFKK